MLVTDKQASPYQDRSEPNRGQPANVAVAFFDLDRTLVDGYTLTAFAAERLRSGLLSWKDLRAQGAAVARYLMGRSGYNELMRTCLAQLEVSTFFP